MPNIIDFLKNLVSQSAVQQPQAPPLGGMRPDRPSVLPSFSPQQGPASMVAGQIKEFTNALGPVGQDNPDIVKQFTKKALDIAMGPQTAEAAEVPPQVQQAVKTDSQPGIPSNQLDNQQPSAIFKALKHVGVPALATILGSTGTMPLAGAAGLSSGYAKGFSKSQERKSKAAEKQQQEEEKQETIKRYARMEARKRLKDRVDLDPEFKFRLAQNPRLYESELEKETTKVFEEWGIVSRQPIKKKPSLQKPSHVAQSDWDAATEKQQRELLKNLGLL